MTIKLPDELRAKIEAKAKQFGFASVEEYVLDLVEHDEDYVTPTKNSALSFSTREELEALLLEGVNSGPPVRVDEQFWKSLREKIRTGHLRQAEQPT